jgi:hypothetical protein
LCWFDLYQGIALAMPQEFEKMKSGFSR